MGKMIKYTPSNAMTYSMFTAQKYTVFYARNATEKRLTVSFESLGNIVGMSILIGSK